MRDTAVAGQEDPDGVTAELREAWQQNGLAVLPQVVPHDQIDRHVALVNELRSQFPCRRDDHGLGDRIGQLHQKIPELIDTVSSRRLLAFAKYALQDDPLLFASLNFERGIQQEAHVDLIYFCTQPLQAMIGIWVALEDIHIDAGPLFYHLSSHEWQFPYVGEIEPAVQENGGESVSPEVIAARAKKWLARLGNEIKVKDSQRTPTAIRKGDAVVWRARLAHGGMPSVDASLSRRSVVYYFIDTASRLLTYEEFSTYPKEELLKRPGLAVPTSKRGNVTFQRHPYFVTNHEGQEIVHQL